MKFEWHLEMSLVGSYGERFTMRVGLDEQTARECYRLPPPVPGLMSFDETVTCLKMREFRKTLFIAEAHRLGTLLAERMEDAEGWHDASRVEPAKQELSDP